MGLNAALLNSSRALEVFSAGIQVAGQNIANVNTPGYIRETLVLKVADPFQKGGLIFGTGVLAEGIVQEIDKFLETRIHTANSDASASLARRTIFEQLETQIRELGDTDLSTSLSSFLNTIHNTVNQPESASIRQLVLLQGKQLKSDILSFRLRLNELRETQTIKVDSLVKEANGLISLIADLNPKISTLEAAGILGSDAGALRTQRYTAMNRLSEIVPVKFRERKDGGVDVFSGSDFLILSGITQQLETFLEVDRNVNVQSVRLSKTGSLISNAAGGELRGIIDGRDVVLGGFVDDLDSFAANIIFEFNKIHSSGEGLVGFTSVTSFDKVLDSTAALNSAAAGLNFTPLHGSFQLKIKNSLSGIVETTNITIDLNGIGADTSLNDLRAAIDAVANVSASITTTGRLKIDADSNFEVMFSNDTSGILAALGINTFFTGSDSNDIGVNAIIENDHRFLATGQGAGPSDNRNAVLLAVFSDQPVQALGNITLEEFYESSVSRIAQGAATESAIAEGFVAFRESLLGQRAQFSGVSLDEEAIKILEFQHSFQASARLISTIDELFTILLTM